MVKMCRKCEDWEQLNATLTLVSKRRSQSTKAVLGMVQEAMGWIEETPTPEAKLALLNTLRDITDGKIFLEAERARLTRQLAALHEAAGRVDQAADVLQEVHVETYGSLDKREKAEFILEQIRLTLAKKDYVRALIQSRKISRKVLEEEDMQDIKINFYRLMIEYHTYEEDPLELCRHYHSILHTPKVAEDDAQWKEALEATVLFLVLSPQTNTQQDLLQKVALDTRLEKLPNFKNLTTVFTTQQVIGYPLQGQQDLEAHPCLARHAPPTLPQKWAQQLRTRTVQHSIRVVSKYYKRIRMQRLAELLGLDVPQTESHLSTMVSAGSELVTPTGPSEKDVSAGEGSALYARIDRPAGIVSFSKHQPPEEILSAWNADISELLGLVEKTCHLINKENMLNKINTNRK
eukprot:CAMPEP_0113942926 /NCGR_PEP_ID=MMETSP1339-20121228/14958_1 /TAXON_ID=94617 /ORGANISM="Fibrocapsa japonica" /LENGTH=404 /DNA_ID=CAMNT_0000947617 /DNA_START=237 /DNA_END=1451 /DNA_ORIENTATION=+ /assembly_acc=CAM_ASM_000762